MAFKKLKIISEEGLTLSENILIIADPALKNIPFEALHDKKTI